MQALFKQHKRLLLIAALFIVGGLSLWQSRQAASPALPQVSKSRLALDHRLGDNAADDSKAALSVALTQPQTVQWPLTLVLNGSINAWQEALVSAEIAGLRIQQVQGEVGSVVRKGQLLVALADDTVKADVQKQLATVERDKAALAEARSNAERAREIQDSGALSAQKINEYLIAEQTARANLALSEAELENQRIRLRQTRVVAPDDGVIASRSANLGNVVSAGSELFRLVRQGRIEWRGEVNAEQLASVHPGQTVMLNLTGGQTVKGRVRMVAPTVDNNTRNALVYVDIPKDSARPGMYVQGRIDVGQQQGLAVPLSAVTYRDGFAYVFELAADNNGVRRVLQRKVHTGRTRDGLIEVLGGLSPQAALVRSGGAFLNDGDRVRVVQSGKDGA